MAPATLRRAPKKALLPPAIRPDRLAALETLSLAHGSHDRREQGMCALEAVAWLVGTPHTDHPACVCPLIAAYVRRLNDDLPAAERGRLRPYLPRLVGTVGNAARRNARAYAAADFAVREAAAQAMDVAQLPAHAATLRALAPGIDRETAKRSRYVCTVARGAAADRALDAADIDSTDAVQAADAALYAAATADYAVAALNAADVDDAYVAAAIYAYAATNRVPPPGDRVALAFALLDRLLAVAA